MEQSNINEFLLSEERVLWSGKPLKPIGILRNEKINIIFGAFWMIFSILWIILVCVTMRPFQEAGFQVKDIFPFLGVPFVAIGMHLSVVYPIKIIQKRKDVEYALTNKRILILYNGKSMKLQAFSYKNVQNLNFGCDETGNGCVTFMCNTLEKTSGSTTSTITHTSATKIYGFHNIDQVKKVYKIFCIQTGEKEI